jgi:hypothetical protein
MRGGGDRLFSLSRKRGEVRKFTPDQILHYQNSQLAFRYGPWSVKLV